MNATNVVINAKDSAEIASNITANNNVNITAGNGVTFTESANTASNQGTAVNVGIGLVRQSMLKPVLPFLTSMALSASTKPITLLLPPQARM